MNERTGRNAPLWVKVFVPIHLIAITSWSLPYAPREFVGNPPQKRLSLRTDSFPELMQSAAELVRNEVLIGNQVYVKDSPLKFYLLGTGFWQYWDMFSPNPANVDLYCDAFVSYRDGSRKHYEYPRMFNLSLSRKFIKERWRKFFERVSDPRFRYLWNSFGRRIALESFDDPANPPTVVELHRRSLDINPPGVPPNRTYRDELFYTYRVSDLAGLRRDKGF